MIKLVNIIALFILFYMPYSLANNSLEHNWRGSQCESYNDGLSDGTYNFIFHDNGYIESYLEFFTDPSCTIAIGTKSMQSSGIYRIKRISEKEDGTHYDLEVKYNNLSFVLEYQAIVKQNFMNLCRDNHCETYKKN